MTYRALSLLLTICVLAYAHAARACEVALAFAVDVSGSISDTDYRIQMRGLAEGLRDPMVINALARGDSALMVILWSGHGEQVVAIDWRQMNSDIDVTAFAAEVENLHRPWSQSATAIGEALEASAAAMTRAPVCDRYVLDISGDGRSNEGDLPELQRDALMAVNLTVNAIVVDTTGGQLHRYYESSVIHGPDAFAVVVQNIDDFAQVMRRKLYRELAIQLVSLE
ncbi:DUF1194 domain-containing protein [Rhodobacterales bacterium HKCCE3408]|nr:DUF1194 domain-containing protein [Rhodobacterales bacterium HKCCE3408]